MAPRLTLSVLGAAVLWAVLWFGGDALLNTSRSLSFDTGAPRNWPVLYDVRFNGADVNPWEFEVADWTADTGPGGGIVTAASIPRYGLFNRAAVEVEATWIEWDSGQAWEATLLFDHPEDLRAKITVYFEADGQISVYRPNAALRAGSLGRMATPLDYELVAQTCGTPLPANDPRTAALDAARAENAGIDVARIEAAGSPSPPQTACLTQRD